VPETKIEKANKLNKRLDWKVGIKNDKNCYDFKLGLGYNLSKGLKKK